MAIENGRVLKGIESLRDRTANPVFRADVLLSSGEICRGFIKDLDPRQMGNELVVASLGKKLGVAVPDVALVVIESAISSAFSKIPHSNGKDYVAFCSIDASGSTVAQMLKTGANVHAISAVKSSPAMGNMYGFDTWVANIDRHQNNLIISGDGKVYLIDHGHCFTGPNWSASNLNATNAYINRLAQWLTPLLTEKEKDGAMADIQQLTAKMVSADIQAIFDDSLAETLLWRE